MKQCVTRREAVEQSDRQWGWALFMWHHPGSTVTTILYCPFLWEIPYICSYQMTRI